MDDTRQKPILFQAPQGLSQHPLWNVFYEIPQGIEPTPLVPPVHSLFTAQQTFVQPDDHNCKSAQALMSQTSAARLRPPATPVSIQRKAAHLEELEAERANFREDAVERRLVHKLTGQDGLTFASLGPQSGKGL